jgi:hypothetical protein
MKYFGIIFAVAIAIPQPGDPDLDESSNDQFSINKSEDDELICMDWDGQPVDCDSLMEDEEHEEDYDYEAPTCDADIVEHASDAHNRMQSVSDQLAALPDIFKVEDLMGEKCSNKFYNGCCKNDHEDRFWNKKCRKCFSKAASDYLSGNDGKRVAMQLLLAAGNDETKLRALGLFGLSKDVNPIYNTPKLLKKLTWCGWGLLSQDFHTRGKHCLPEAK